MVNGSFTWIVLASLLVNVNVTSANLNDDDDDGGATKAEKCKLYEEKVEKEYDCCVAEAAKILHPVTMTSWFPRLPSLSHAVSLNLTVTHVATVYCNVLDSTLLCMNKKFNRLQKTGPLKVTNLDFAPHCSSTPDDIAPPTSQIDHHSCFDNSTVDQFDAELRIYQWRARYLCANSARNLLVLYESSAHRCLEGKQTHVCMKHIAIDGFRFDGFGHSPNCRVFSRILDCLQDEWSELCGTEGSIQLVTLLKNFYARIHCPHLPLKDVEDYAAATVTSTMSMSMLTATNYRLIVAIVLETMFLF